MLGTATATPEHYDRLQEISWDLGQSVYLTTHRSAREGTDDVPIR